MDIYSNRTQNVSLQFRKTFIEIARVEKLQRQLVEYISTSERVRKLAIKN